MFFRWLWKRLDRLSWVQLWVTTDIQTICRHPYRSGNPGRKFAKPFESLIVSHRKWSIWCLSISVSAKLARSDASTFCPSRRETGRTPCYTSTCPQTAMPRTTCWSGMELSSRSISRGSHSCRKKSSCFESGSDSATAELLHMISWSTSKGLILRLQPALVFSYVQTISVVEMMQ